MINEITDAKLTVEARLAHAGTATFTMTKEGCEFTFPACGSFRDIHQFKRFLREVESAIGSVKIAADRMEALNLVLVEANKEFKTHEVVQNLGQRLNMVTPTTIVDGSGSAIGLLGKSEGPLKIDRLPPVVPGQRDRLS